jgi:predicted NAD/FAD-binding protein
MRIAIIGSGVSGLTCAHLLFGHHDVHLFEAGDRPGGHVRTVEVVQGEERFPVDTGFIIYNKPNYPLFTRLLERLGIQGSPSDMSFSVSLEEPDLEYLGSQRGGLFTQRSNLFNPVHWGMLRDILRFGKRARRLLSSDGEEISLGELLDDWRLGQAFWQRYLLPLVCSLWSVPAARAAELPARQVLGFLDNHFMLQLNGRPQWFAFPQGARSYVNRLLQPLAERLHLNSPVLGVTRHSDHVELELPGGNRQSFDHVIMALHSNQALEILRDPTVEEQDILKALPYQDNRVILHSDPRLMPRRRRAWGSWNYRVTPLSKRAATLSYSMNHLQGFNSRLPLLVSLNPEIEPAMKHEEHLVAHPQFTLGTPAAQKRRWEICTNRTWYCGAYWGHGFHEDGVRSANELCHKMAGLSL